MISSYLVFLLSGRFFGVKLLGAIEILPLRRLRSVPLSYSHVEGLIDYRGTIYPVFNLSQWIGINRLVPTGFIAAAKAQAAGGQSIILLEENKVPFGIIVDSVSKMTKLEEPRPDGAFENIQGIETRYVKGIAYEDDHEILILDFERLLHAS
jgi:purine-binding chemotaxis protein CheW